MDSVREIHMIATATFSLLSVVTWSIIRFTVWGPTISVWTYRTQLSHDLLQFMATCSAFPILHQVNQACLEYWPRLAQYINPSREPLTQFQIPQYQLTEADVERAGMWSNKLRAISHPPLGIDAECTSPISDTSQYIVLYVHGGAYTMGSARQYRGIHIQMARASQMRVLGFSYRLAPTHTYPVPLYDAYMAYKHVRHMGYADTQIVVAGDSAGGNLALALWQLTRATFHALVLFSPRVDVVSFRQSWKTYNHIDILQAYDIQDPVSPIHQLLVPNNKSLSDLDVLSDPFVAPIHADFTGLPPTLVQMGGAEVMGDDIQEFTKRARMQGAHIELQVYDNMFHVFQASLPKTQHLDEAWDNVHAFLHS
ncbi:hypothetical protein IW142_004817 [Coemansia sp. RSA 564]|nr:hypothetical protein IW142_004817 [Coemansia sp. RSA 564]KAJ2150697.1 hypothetical protein J3F82_003822 [Coemansia sp. RSA 637]